MTRKSVGIFKNMHFDTHFEFTKNFEVCVKFAFPFFSQLIFSLRSQVVLSIEIENEKFELFRTLIEKNRAV